MSVRRESGRTKLIYLPKTPSIAIDAGEYLKLNDSGGVRPAISAANERIVGASRDSHATSDTTSNPIAVEVPIEQWVEWEVDTDSDGGAADSDVGGYRDLDTLGANIDVSATTDKVFLITRVKSATKVVGVLAKSAVNSWDATADIST